jgi:dihydrofolate reductase
MGRLIIQDFVSADGFAADVNGDFTIYEHLEGSLDEFNASQLAWLDGIETMVLGANTYRLFADYWPQATAEQDIVAPVLNALRRHVFSSTLESAPWGDAEPAVLESGDAVEAIRRIKAESTGDVVLWGSLRLGKSFLAADEVDEIRLIVLPVALGEGVGVFPAGRPPHVMRPVSVQTYDDGVVELVLDPRSRHSPGQG